MAAYSFHVLFHAVFQIFLSKILYVNTSIMQNIMAGLDYASTSLATAPFLLWIYDFLTSVPLQ